MENKPSTQAKLTRQQAVDRCLKQLPTMERKALLKLWRDLFDQVPSPALRRETLIPILAYRVQEKAFGGLRASTVRKLRELAGDYALVESLFRSPRDPRSARAMSANTRTSCMRSRSLNRATSTKTRSIGA